MTASHDSGRWGRIRDLLEAALEQPAPARASWLDEAAGGDPALRAEVIRLLDADERAGAQLESPLDVGSAFVDGSDEPTLSRGDHIGTYLIEEELARGGMGVVYRAWDTRLERWVALKALAPTMPADLQGRERLHREARAAGRLSHESIATIYALEEVDGNLYIASEFVPGQTLRARLSEGPMPMREAIDVLLRVANGLAAAHQAGIVHRDLKPENVMLTNGGRVKVVDFGIASVGGSSGQTRTGVILGTPGYMSPEQIKGQPADPRSDVFSLGVLLYEMVSGRPPFGDTASWTVVSAVLERDPAPLGQVIDGVPLALERVAMTCLAKTPASRYASAEGVAVALEVVAAGFGTRPNANVLQPAGTGPVTVSSGPAEVTGAHRWLQVHQLAASAALALMMIPAWKLMSRLPRLPGRLLVMALLIIAAGVGTLRLHLWFTTRHAGTGLASEVQRVGPTITWGNRLFALLLAIGGAAIVDQAIELGAVCLACAAGTLVAGEVIEPATINRAIGPPNQPAQPTQPNQPNQNG